MESISVPLMTIAQIWLLALRTVTAHQEVIALPVAVVLVIVLLFALKILTLSQDYCHLKLFLFPPNEKNSARKRMWSAVKCAVTDMGDVQQNMVNARRKQSTVWEDVNQKENIAWSCELTPFFLTNLRSWFIS